MPTTTWTKEAVLDLIARNPRAVERAMVALLAKQTQDEQATEQTRHSNGVGFSGCNARRGTYYAKWVLSGKHLTGRHFDSATKIAKMHAGQFARIANERGVR